MSSKQQASHNGEGFFITIEGIEGAGKSTLALSLQKHFASEGFDVVVTAEPGGDPVSEKIRDILLDRTNVISVRAELLLFESARAQHVEMVILPALRRGCIVISDRFADSSLAYQGWARKQDVEEVRMLNEYATQGLKPDITLLLDLPPQEGLARQLKVDRMSAEDIAFHEAVRNGYLAMAKCEPDRFVVIDATMEPGEVLKKAIDAIAERLKL
jgi:dTMP kinase